MLISQFTIYKHTKTPNISDFAAYFEIESVTRNYRTESEDWDRISLLNPAFSKMQCQQDITGSRINILRITFSTHWKIW